MVYLWLILSVIFCIILFYPKQKEVNEFGFSGKLIYVDEGKSSKVFLSHKYKICAKPDFIYKTGLSYTLVERKSGYREPESSDVAQIIAAVIATRSSYRVTRAILSTKKGVYNIDVSGSSAQLFKKIKKHHELTQLIYKGVYVGEHCASPKKCKTCATRNACLINKG